MIRPAYLELLESRIAPALVVVNPLADILVGAGQSGKTIELSQMFDSQITTAGHTIVTFTLNLDADPNTAAIEPTTFQLELFDDEAPLTVQNFLRYVETPTGSAEFLNTFFHRSVSGFVVQGGGYSASGSGSHIPVFPEVHNEFSDDRSNVRGTIAMAKTGVSSNSATSEWFVNLADNSSNLDNQNGGFTVFGQVVGNGMDVFDKIAALPTANLGGAFDTVPVQKLSSGASPGLDNLIRVTDIHVESPQAGSIGGITYAVASSNPGLVKTKISDSKLQLTYNNKSAGVATITVNAKSGTDTTTETFLVTLRPNLTSAVGSDVLQTIVVPGDDGKATIVIRNTGGGAYSGPVNVKFFLSQERGSSDTVDPDGYVLDDSDLSIGGLMRKITIPGGGSVKIVTNLFIDSKLLEGGDQTYRVLAQVVPQNTNPNSNELFSDDNVSLNGGEHLLTNRFGTFSTTFKTQAVSRSNAVLTYSDFATGQPVTFSLKGPGTGRITIDSLQDGLPNLLVSNTTAESQLILKSKSEITFDQTDITNTIGTVNLAKANLTGYVTLSGGAKSLVVGDLTDVPLLTIGAFPPLNSQKVSITARRLSDVSIESVQPIGNFKAVDWLDADRLDAGGAHDFLQAPSVALLNVTGNTKAATPIAGDFEANVNIHGTTPTGSVSVKGEIRHSAISTTGTFASVRAGSMDDSSLTTLGMTKLASVFVNGVITESTIKASGDIGSVSVGGLDHSNVFAGVTERPDTLADFSTPHTIGSFTVRALDGVASQFIASQVAAATISKIVVRGIDGDNGGQVFGFVADKVGSYSRVGGPKLSKLDVTTGNHIVDSLTDYELLVL